MSKQAVRATVAQKIVDHLRSRGLPEAEVATILFDAGICVLAEMATNPDDMQRKLQAAMSYIRLAGTAAYSEQAQTGT